MRKRPQRKCLVSNEMFDKDQLVRVVRTPDKKVIVDKTGKANGRGAYIKLSHQNIEKAKVSNVFKKALQVEIPNNIYEELETILNEEKR